MKALLYRNIQLVLNRAMVVGILNVTPDSFSDGGKFLSTDLAVVHAKRMVEDGADVIDVGGESTRPGSTGTSLEEELARVLPVMERLVKEISAPLSIDTRKFEVAEACLKIGAHMVNDVSGLRDERMMEVVARYKAPVVIMHMQGTPETMQQNPTYGNAVEDIKTFLAAQAKKAKEAGIEEVIIDPGIGFGKTIEHNLSIIKHLKEFKELGYPVFIGPSRKSFLGNMLNISLEERLSPTIAALTACVLNGADFLRVHDVKECKRAILVAQAIKNAS